MLIAYSTAEGELASDVGAAAGPYAKVLAEEIVLPGIEAVYMFRRVQVPVREAIGQEPWLGFSALGEVHLAGLEPPKPMETSATTPASTVRLSEAAEAWDRTKDTISIVALEAFIRRFGDTYYSDLANARLQEIKGGSVAHTGTAREYPDLAATYCQPTHGTDSIIGACSDIIARFPTFAMPYAYRGNAYWHQGD
jgi:hypothetical protein